MEQETRRVHHNFARCFNNFCFASIGDEPTALIVASHLTIVDEKQTTYFDSKVKNQEDGNKTS